MDFVTRPRERVTDEQALKVLLVARHIVSERLTVPAVEVYT